MVVISRGLLFAVLLLSAPDARARQHEHRADPPAVAEPRVVVTAVAADTTDAAPLTLDEVISRVRATNPSLEASRLEARAAGYRSRQVDQLPDPMISGMVMTGAGRMARSEWMIEQSFPWPGTLASRRSVAERAADQVTWATHALGADLEFSASEQYLQAAAIDRKLDHLTHFVEELRGFEAAAAAKYEVGDGPQQAILRLQLERNAINERVGLLLRDRNDRLETLRRLMGGAPFEGWTDRPLEFPDELNRPETSDRDRWAPDQTEPSRTVDEAELDAALEAAEARIRLAELDFKPSFSARLSLIEGSVMRRDRDAVGIGGAVMIPLWRDGRRSAVEEAKVLRSRVESQAEALRLRLDTERSAARARLEQNRRLLLLVDGTLLPQAEATHQATASAYTNGRADYLDLVDAERMLLDLRLSRVDRMLEIALDEVLMARLYRRPDSDR